MFTRTIRLAVLCAGAAALARADVVINEIHYDSEPNTRRDEFVEIHNTGPQAVDLGGWAFTDGIAFTFPPGTTLNAGAYLVVAEDPATMLSLHGVSALGPYAGGLSNDGEDVELSDASGTRVDLVDYRVEFPWPIAPSTEGVSMELIHPSLDRELGGSWRAGGFTPGAPNSVHASNAPPQARQVDHWPEQPTDSEPTVVSVKVTDPQGVASVQLQYRLVLPGQYVPAFLAKPHSELLANPNAPRTPNPAYETGWVTTAMLDNGANGDVLAGDDTYTATIPAQANRTLVRYRIIVEDNAGSSVRIPYTDDPSLNFAYFVYDGVPDYIADTRSVTGQVPTTHPKETLTTLPVYTMLTTQADYDQCVAYNSTYRIPSNNYDARSAFNWSATFVYNGKVHDNIAYRLRQRNARYSGSGKRSVRFRFNDGNHIQLHDDNGNPYPTKWRTINSHKMTGSRGGANFGLYESANAVLWNLTGTPAPYTHWFHFRVIKGTDEQPSGANGQHTGDFFGLLLAMEDYDVRFLDSHDLERGNLYKLKTGGTDGLSVQRYQAPNAVDDASDFTTIINQLRNTQPDSWLHDHVNWDSYYRYHAIVDAVRHYDVSNGITTNNGEHLKNRAYFFQPDPSNPLGKLNLMPWDSDTSWGPNWNGGWDWPKNAMADRLSFNRDYKNVVREIRDLVWQEDQVNQLLDDYQARLQDFQLADRDRWTNAQGSPTPGSQNDGPMSNRVEDMKRFAFDGGSWSGGNSTNRDFVFDSGGSLSANNSISRDDGISGQQGRDAYLDALAYDPSIPDQPTITYTGVAGFPVNGLAFQSSLYSDPQGSGTFAAMEWRVAEVVPDNAPDPDVLSPLGATWKYDDSGADRLASDIVDGHPSYDATNWKHPGFDDSGWSSGPAELGYGDNPATELDFGGNSSDKHITYYFRRQFNVSGTDQYESYLLRLKRDDGAIVYINGMEAGRTRMASGPAGSRTPANATASGAGETALHDIPVPASMIVEGDNTIAVEIHQVNSTSSDIRMDLLLQGIRPDPNSFTSLTFEWDADWESGEQTIFSPSVTIPTAVARDGRTYRARVRHRDNSGRWSHWSAPLEFTATLPDISVYLDHLVISELMYHPADATPAEAALGFSNSDFEWIELHNTSTTLTLNLTDLRFTKGIDFDIPAGTMLAPGAYALVVRNTAAFGHRYGTGYQIIGEYLDDKLSNDGERLKLSYGAGAAIRDFTYNDVPPWPDDPASGGPSITLRDPAGLPDLNDGSNWAASAFGGGSPGGPEALTYPIWILAYHNVSDPASDPNADPDHDGFVNLLEYALATHPDDPNSHPDLQPGIVDIDGTPYFTVEYTERTDATDLAIVPETSHDLVTWSDDPTETTVFLSVDHGDGTRTVIRRDQTAATASQRFLRIRVDGM